jgi:hypothetical protein
MKEKFSSIIMVKHDRKIKIIKRIFLVKKKVLLFANVKKKFINNNL